MRTCASCAVQPGLASWDRPAGTGRTRRQRVFVAGRSRKPGTAGAIDGGSAESFTPDGGQVTGRSDRGGYQPQTIFQLPVLRVYERGSCRITALFTGDSVQIGCARAQRSGAPPALAGSGPGVVTAGTGRSIEGSGAGHRHLSGSLPRSVRCARLAMRSRPPDTTPQTASRALRPARRSLLRQALAL